MLTEKIGGLMEFAPRRLGANIYNKKMPELDSNRFTNCVVCKKTIEQPYTLCSICFARNKRYRQRSSKKKKAAATLRK